jgi:hypothetical protein
MFDDKPNDKIATLAEMRRVARARTNFSETDANRLMGQYMAQDVRFREFDHAKVIDRVNRCMSNGARFDIDDPELKRGGQPRPLALKGRSGAV